MVENTYVYITSMDMFGIVEAVEETEALVFCVTAPSRLIKVPIEDLLSLEEAVPAQ
ncbi:MAG: hypothetical protein ACOZCL_13370 [Bacillota bacterium]